MEVSSRAVMRSIRVEYVRFMDPLAPGEHTGGLWVNNARNRKRIIHPRPL
jgi:hypothetical protein